MNSGKATQNGVQLLAEDLKQDVNNITMGIQGFKRIPQAYEQAPMYGRMQGALYGIPAGLAAGGLTYGALSLIPWIRRKKKTKAAISLLAAIGGGWHIGKPVFEKARDLYFENATGVSSPWKEHRLTQNADWTPSDVIDSYAKAFAEAKQDPIGYFNKQWAKHTYDKQPKHRTPIQSEVLDSYLDAFDQAKGNVGGYLKDTFDKNIQQQVKPLFSNLEK